ncbi:hypothetical protein B0H19DRAFT_1254183 [Mycena capillaripes]|nr:hypothetical protein B0H19DRAFT_1254183 [Mycena capillaripes]
MSNVESLYIESTPLTKSLITTISKLKNTLKTLCIRSCTLEGDLTKSQLLGMDSLRLRVVEFFRASSVSPSLSPSTIRLRDVETFKTDSWPFGYFFMKRQHPTLHVLELHDVEDLPALFKFLAKSPSIRELTVASIVLKLGVAAMPSLAPTALPNIQTVRVPASFLPFFFNRTLRNVALVGVEARDFEGNDRVRHPALPLLTIKDITPLLNSAASITELHLPQHVYFVFPVFKHLKHLEVLVLAYNHPNFSTDLPISSSGLFRNAIHLLCNKWPASPSVSLCELRLDFGTSVAADARPFMWDLQLQLEMLTDPLRAAFPRLTSANIARFVKWQRWDEHSEWCPFVPHALRDFVKDALARGRRFIDVRGCFEPYGYKRSGMCFFRISPFAHSLAHS